MGGVKEKGLAQFLTQLLDNDKLHSEFMESLTLVIY
jgi:hypothetical protein